MKKLCIVALMGVVLFSCTPGTDKNKPADVDKNGVVETTTTTTQQNATVDNNPPSEGKPISISEDDFAKNVFDFRKGGKWKYKGDKPAIIDFYADWCGPCKMIAPFMKEFAATYKDQIYVYKVNTDNAQDLAMFYEINAIPAVMLCPIKGDYQMIVGANTKEHYESLIKSVLLK